MRTATNFLTHSLKPLTMPTPLLTIPWDASGTLISRPNRFLALVDIDEKCCQTLENEKVHVHDPGRLKELLYPGNRLLLRRMEGAKRKTKWDLIAAKNGEDWILVHSGYHRKITEAVLARPDISPFGELESFKAEVTMGNSRLDFLLQQKGGRPCAAEVKGCTLTVDGAALFPDAPTLRGRRHLQTLTSLQKEGKMDTAVMILVFRQDSETFSPFTKRDPEFAEAFWKAVDAGVQVYPLLLDYDGRKIQFLGQIPVKR